jgi:putative transcription factor
VRCEVCGRKIYGKQYRVKIEGAKLTVCGKCAKLGTIIWEETKPETSMPGKRVPTRRVASKTRSKKPLQAVVESTLELIEDFDAKIRRARRKLGLSHKELGKKISEKVSVLKKIETAKMTPDNKLATKLEHALKIKLLVQPSEEKVPETKIPKPVSHELTLGDLIQLDKKKAEEKTQRKQS